jgi:hypothetical protein
LLEEIVVRNNLGHKKQEKIINLFIGEKRSEREREGP